MFSWPDGLKNRARESQGHKASFVFIRGSSYVNTGLVHLVSELLRMSELLISDQVSGVYNKTIF